MGLRLAYLAKSVKPKNAYLATRRPTEPPGPAMAQKHEAPHEAGLIREATFLVTQTVRSVPSVKANIRYSKVVIFLAVSSIFLC